MLRIFGSITALGLFLALFSSPLQALDPNYNFEVVAVNGQTIDGLTVGSIQFAADRQFRRSRILWRIPSRSHF